MPKYPQIYQEVSERIRTTLTELESYEVSKLSSQIAQLAHGEARRRAEIKARGMLLSIREQLIYLSETTPHCTLCGWRFSSASIASFLGDSTEEPELPLLIDIYKPIGLSLRHLLIEVDHIVPHSRGGRTTLRLFGCPVGGAMLINPTDPRSTKCREKPAPRYLARIAEACLSHFGWCVYWHSRRNGAVSLQGFPS